MHSNRNFIPRSNAAPPNRRLTTAQLYLLEIYNLQYNEVMQQINTRYIDAVNIRNNMNAIIAATFPNVIPTSTTNANANANANANTNANTNAIPTPNNSNNPMYNSNFTALNHHLHSPLRRRNNGLYGPSDFPSSWSLNSFFDRVDVSPSTEQINTSTRTLRFCDIETPINDRCPISFETFIPEDNVLQIIHCGHIFNPCEIAVWFRSNVGCPVCRYDIRNHSHTPRNPLTSALPSIPNMEETKEDNADQEFKETDPTPINATTNTNARSNTNARTNVDADANDNIESNTEALIEALLYVLMPGSTNRNNNAPSTSNASSISYDPSNNMYFFDYYLGNRD